MANLFDVLQNMANKQSVATQKAINTKVPVKPIQGPSLSEVTRPRQSVSAAQAPGIRSGFVPSGLDSWKFVNKQGEVAENVAGPYLGSKSGRGIVNMNPSARIITGPGQGLRGRDFGSLTDDDLAQTMLYGQRLQNPYRAGAESGQSRREYFNENPYASYYDPGSVPAAPGEEGSFEKGMKTLTYDLNRDGEVNWWEVPAAVGIDAVGGRAIGMGWKFGSPAIKSVAGKATDKAIYGMGKYPISPTMRAQTRAQKDAARKAAVKDAGTKAKKTGRKAAEKAVGMGTHPISPALRAEMLKRRALIGSGIAGGVGGSAAYLAWLLDNYADEVQKEK